MTKWQIAGQIATVWVMVAFVTAPFIGRYLRARRNNKELRNHANGLENLRASLYVADAEIERRLAREAVVPITENQWLQNARQAEALTWLDEDPPNPKRVA